MNLTRIALLVLFVFTQALSVAKSSEGSSLTESQPAILVDDTRALVVNCKGCSRVPFGVHTVAGAVRLARNFGLNGGAVAVIHDYSSNYTHVVSIEAGERVKVGILRSFRTSGGRGGISNKIGSGGTPPGAHIITHKQGQEFKKGQTFDAGKYGFQETILTPTTGRENWEHDFILTRILRLKGIEGGLNDNSVKRGIFFHGTVEEGLLGFDESAGCIRLGNDDVVEFFNLVKVGMIVLIVSENSMPNRIKRSLLKKWDVSKVKGLQKLSGSTVG